MTIKFLISRVMILFALSFSIIQTSIAEVVWKSDKEEKKKILKFRPQNQFGYAGVLPVTKHNDTIYVLLSREAFGGAKDTYCDFGGKVDKKNDGTFYTFGTTATNELKEESSSVYKTDKDTIVKNARLYYFNDNNGKVNGVMAFLPLDFIKRTKFLEERQKFENMGKKYYKFYEKDDFQWVNLKSLIDATNNLDSSSHQDVKVNVLKNDGSGELEMKLTLRKHFLRSFQKSQKNFKKNEIGIPQTYIKKGL